MSGQSILDHQRSSFIYSCLSTWWDITAVTPDRNLSSPCQQWWMFLSIQSDLSPDHQRSDLQAASTLYETVSACSCMIQPVHSLSTWFVCRQTLKLGSPLETPPSGRPCAWCRPRCHGCMLLRCQTHDLFPPRIEIEYVETRPEPPNGKPEIRHLYFGQLNM